MKALRERVLDELQILQEEKPDSLSFDDRMMNNPDNFKYDVESLYNMQGTNNTNAMGFDNLPERGAA